MRRPLCIALLVFLAVYLTALSGRIGDRDGKEQTGVGKMWSGRRVLLAGCARSLYEPADGSQENMSFIIQNIQPLSDTGGGSGDEAVQLPQKEVFLIAKQKVLCRLQKGQSLPREGSGVTVRGVVRPFLEATNPGEFDAAAYYARQGVCFSLQDAQIVAQGERYDRLADFLYGCKRRTAALYYRLLGEADGSVASAMALGIKKGMDAGTKLLYQDAGIAHVLAISGLHITFIGMALWKFLEKCRLPKILAALCCVSVLVLYGKTVGMGISTKRALWMFALMLAAGLARRTPDTLTSLACAACILLVRNPAQISDSGFWLSFSAVAGAVLLVPVLQEEGIKRPGREEGRVLRGMRAVKKSVTASFGISLFMLPVLLSCFYKWNPWSVLANLIVLPLLGALLLCLFVLASAGLVFDLAAAAGLPFGAPVSVRVLRLLALPARGIFWAYREICRATVRLPGSGLRAGVPEPWQLLLFAAGVTALLLWGKKLPPKPRMACAVLLAAVFMVRLPGKLTVTMLDVGQGECVCVETAGHHVYLLDAGSSSQKNAGQYQIIPFLEYSGVRRLEGIFVSHWDADHVNALGQLLEWAKKGQVGIGGLYLPDTTMEDGGLEELLSLAQTYAVRVERIRAGQELRDGETVFRCLHPCAGKTYADRNGSSAVIRLEHGSFGALFTGDLEADGEAWLLETYGDGSLDCSLLDAGHHGAANATTEEFLEAVNPQAVLISCGRNNSYGHPDQKTLSRIAASGAAYYVTARDGAVTVRVDGKGMTVSRFGS